MPKLFRNEAVTEQAERLPGTVLIATPMAWWIISVFMFLGVMIAGTFFALTEYSRVETAEGLIVPDKGIATIFPPRGGVLSKLEVEEGSFVEAGSVLATVNVHDALASGERSTRLSEEIIAEQDASLIAQLEAARQTLSSQKAQAESRIAGLKSEIEQLHRQREIQEELIKASEANIANVETAVKRGFISKRDYQNRKETLLSRRQQLAQLLQSIEGRRTEQADVERNIQTLAAESERLQASIQASRAQIAQQTLEMRREESFALVAPISGTVTALRGRIGQAVSPREAFANIIPEAAVLEAELSVPSSAVGFVQVGQNVRITIDAFPYQRFGTVKGKIQTMARAAVMQRDLRTGRDIPVYPVVVSLEREHIDAFGQRHKLVPGMSLSARIIAGKQSLFEWLLEPLLAVKNR